MAGVPKNRSLQAKSAARMAAVQLIYRAKMRGGVIQPETLTAEYESFRSGEALMKGEAPNKALLNKLLHGLAEHEVALETLVSEQLKEGFGAARTNPILLAILKLAAFELDGDRSSKPPVIIDEYTHIAAKLLEQDEIAFVHASLKILTEKIRG